MMAEPEKTILDSIHRPIYSGDMPENCCDALARQKFIAMDRLGEFTFRFKLKSLIQRLGYLVELLAIPASEPFRDKLLAKMGKTHVTWVNLRAGVKGVNIVENGKS